MKNREWNHVFKGWKEYKLKEPEAFLKTESLCRELTKLWPDCFVWAMWSIKHGSDPRLIDGAVNYVLKNKDNPKMTFHRQKNKHAYMNKVIQDEGNQAAVADGRWQDVKMSNNGMAGLGSILGKVESSIIIADKDREIAELKKQLERLK